MTGESWKGRAAQRRDARATKAPDASAPHRSSKNTKKWCRGKVGVAHKLKCADYDTLKQSVYRVTSSMSSKWKVLYCTECGKELDHWYPFGNRTDNPPPDWVTKG